jgi:hypothetical protein
VDSLAATGCNTVNAASVIGDTNGGIALSNTRVFDGGSSCGRFAATDLSGGVSLGRAVNGLVSNLRTGEVYTLASATAPLATGSGSQTITRLIRLDPNTGAQTTTVITLSAGITVNTSSNTAGVYSGYDRVAIHNGTNVFHVELPSGTVSDRGAMALPALRRACTGSWANWGVVEFFGGVLYLDYVRTNNTIARASVTGGTVTNLATFTNLGDMCSFIVSPTRGRWYFSADVNTQFNATATETLGYCTATSSRPGDTFQVTALSATACGTMETSPIIGDDRGGLAVSSTTLFYNGDAATGRFSPADLRGGAAVSPSRTIDGLVANLAREQVFTLGNGAAAIASPAIGGTVVVNSLLELDGAGTLTGRSIPLSQSITMVYGSGVFSGWNMILLWNGSRMFEVALPTGTVVDLGAVALSGLACETWAFFGTAEFFGGVHYVDYVASSTRIVRTAVPAGTTANIATYTNLGDSCSIAYAPSRGRWYWHSSLPTQFRTPGPAELQDETTGYCGGSHSNP